MSCQALIKLNFLDRYLKNPQISNFIKTHLVGAQLFHVDGWTDMMMLAVAFCNFLNAFNIILRQFIVIFTHNSISALCSHFLAP